LQGRITFLTAFLTDFRATLLARAIFEAMDETDEGKESRVEAQEEAREECEVAQSWPMITEQDVQLEKIEVRVNVIFIHNCVPGPLSHETRSMLHWAFHCLELNSTCGKYQPRGLRMV